MKENKTISWHSVSNYGKKISWYLYSILHLFKDFLEAEAVLGGGGDCRHYEYILLGKNGQNFKFFVYFYYYYIFIILLFPSYFIEMTVLNIIFHCFYHKFKPHTPFQTKLLL